MKLPKLNQKGIAHILAPLLFIVLFAAVGGYVLLKSHAAPVLTDGGGGGTLDPHGYLVQGFVKHGAQKMPGAYVHFSYTLKGSSQLSKVTLLSDSKGWYQFRAYANTAYTITTDYIYNAANTAKTLGDAYVSDTINLPTGTNVGPTQGQSIQNIFKDIILTHSQKITIPECAGNLAACGNGTVMGTFAQREGATLQIAGGTAPITVTPSPANQVSKVVWYNGKTNALLPNSLGANSNPTTAADKNGAYSYTWSISQLGAGQYKITAKIYDKNGNFTNVINDQGYPYLDLTLSGAAQ